MKKLTLATIKKEWKVKLPAGAKIENMKWLSPGWFDSTSERYSGKCKARIARAKVSAPGFKTRNYQVHVEDHPFYGKTWCAF
jgi:hypothetical protein